MIIAAGSSSSLVLVLTLLSNIGVYAQTNTTSTSPSDENSLIIMINLERIRNQVLLAEKSFAINDKDMAFAHSYIPHSVIFPSIKSKLNAINSQSTSRLESLITDIPISIKAEKSAELQSKLQSDLTAIMLLLDNISNKAIEHNASSNKSFIANTTVFLLRDAEQSYRLSNAATATDQQQNNENDNQQFRKVEYENAQGLVNISKSNYEKLSNSLDERRRQEINSFFSQLENSIVRRTGIETISQLVTAIERDLAEYLSSSSSEAAAISNHSQYFTNIKNLLSDVVTEVKESNDYRRADKAAVAAYLDNYE